MIDQFAFRIGSKVFKWDEMTDDKHFEGRSFIDVDRTHILHYSNSEYGFETIHGRDRECALYNELFFDFPEKSITIDSSELPEGLHVEGDQVIITEEFYLHMKELFEQ